MGLGFSAQGLGPQLHFFCDSKKHVFINIPVKVVTWDTKKQHIYVSFGPQNAEKRRNYVSFVPQRAEKRRNYVSLGPQSAEINKFM